MSAQPAPRSRPDLLQAVADRLAPLFFEDCHSREIASMRAARAVEDYGPQSPDEYGTIACILAFSLASICAISRAAESDAQVEHQLRYYDKAIKMNESALRYEALLAKGREARSRGQGAGVVADKQALVAAVDKAMDEYNALQFPLRERSRRSRARSAPQQPPRTPAPQGDKTLC